MGAVASSLNSCAVCWLASVPHGAGMWFGGRSALVPTARCCASCGGLTSGSIATFAYGLIDIDFVGHCGDGYRGCMPPNTEG